MNSNTDRDQRVEQLLHQLIETPAGERIRMTCGAADLRSVITDLLDSQAAGSDREAERVAMEGIKEGLQQRDERAATRMRDLCVAKAEDYRQRIQYESDEGMREALFGDMVIGLQSMPLVEGETND